MDFAALSLNTKEFITSLSLDVLVVAVVVGFFLLIGLRGGKTRLIGLIFSIYIGAMIYMFFPYGDMIPLELGPLFNTFNTVALLTFLVIVGIISTVVDYTLELEFSGQRLRNLASTIILSISASIALLGAVYVTEIVRVDSSKLSLLDSLFTGEQTLFVILILPLVGTFVVVR